MKKVTKQVMAFTVIFGAVILASCGRRIRGRSAGYWPAGCPVPDRKVR